MRNLRYESGRKRVSRPRREVSSRAGDAFSRREIIPEETAGELSPPGGDPFNIERRYA